MPSPGSLRVATTLTTAISDLDPIRIRTINEYELVYNLYGRLFDYTDNQTIVAGLGQQYQLTKDALILDFSSVQIRSLKGRRLNANDAFYSIMRALVLGKTGHTKLQTFLCPDTHIASLTNQYPEIFVESNKLILRPTSPASLPYLIPLLTNADFSILFFDESVDISDPNFPEGKLKDHQNTTGPYRLESYTDQCINLRANTTSTKYTPEMPQAIEIKQCESRDTIDLLVADEIDYAPATTLNVTTSSLLNAYKNPQISFYETAPIRLKSLALSPNALTSFSQEQRFYASHLVAEFHRRFLPLPGGKPAVTFFLESDQMALSAEQRSEVVRLRESTPIPHFDQPMTVSTTDLYYEKMANYFAGSKIIRVLKVDGHALDIPLKSRPDIYSFFSDTADTGNLTMLGHLFETGIFHLLEFAPDVWMTEFVAREDSQRQRDDLNELHFRLLKNCVVYPIECAPYISALRKPWQISVSPFVPGAELWKIRRRDAPQSDPEI